MIPGLLHGRVLSSVPSSGVIAEPAYGSRSVSVSGSSSASAVVSLVIRPDGSWQTTGSGQPDGSGPWYAPITANVGADYQVMITASGSGGTVDNGAASWTALTADRSVTVSAQRFTPGSSAANYSVTVQIRRASDGVIVSTGTLTVSATASVVASSQLPGLDGRIVSATDQALTGQERVMAEASVQLRADGTWIVAGWTSSQAVPQTPPSSGAWHIYGGSAGNYDVQIDAASTGSPARLLANGAPTWSSLDAARGVSLTLPDAPANNASQREAQANVRIRIRRRATGEIVSDNTLTIQVATNGYL